MAEDRDDIEQGDPGGDTRARELREAFTDDDAGWGKIREARQTDIKAGTGEGAVRAALPEGIPYRLACGGDGVVFFLFAVAESVEDQ